MSITRTPAVVRAMEAASRRARGEGREFLSPLDLLHGMLAEEHGRAASLLETVGLDLAAYFETHTIPEATADGDSAGEMQPDPEALRLLHLSHELAFELTGEGTVPSEAVLLALVRESGGVREWLATRKIDAGRLDDLLMADRPPAPVVAESLDVLDVSEGIDLARILDVSFNRAREALRVVEDYCRFGLDDALLSREAKEMRHELTTTLEECAAEELLAARETLRDVGTTISTPEESERASLLAVVQANLKRLQESLRSLEEYGKIRRPLLAARIEQLRYRSYTLERAVVPGAHARRVLREARLYALLTGATCSSALDWTIAEAAAGGVRIVQLREKTLPDNELIARARQVRRWTRKAGVLFIVNDRPDIARLSEADGVHLGQDDLSVKDARRILGPEPLIGVSTHNLEQVRQAVLDGASYIGVGPVFPSGTKSFEHLPGPDFVRAALAETSLPAFAIGGINLETIGRLAAIGVQRVAVSQALAQAEEPSVTAAQLLGALSGGPRGKTFG